MAEYRNTESESLRFDSGDSEFFLCPTLVTRRKTFFTIISLSGTQVETNFRGQIAKCLLFTVALKFLDLERLGYVQTL